MRPQHHPKRRRAVVPRRVPLSLPRLLLFAVCSLAVSLAAHGQILTPPPPAYPIINGPDVFGVRPGNLFLYYVPVTGSSPMTYGANSLPAGISINAGTGEITGTISAAGTYMTTLTASNSYGAAQKSFRIVCGPTISLTPAMGWNSWNAFGSGVTQSDLLATGSAFVNDNLTKYGWIYVNCDDTWQAARSGTLNALTGDTSTFPNIGSMYAQLHAMGLKCGIYSSPWAQSYGHHPAETAENAQGTWVVDNNPELTNKNLVPWAVCRYSFVQNDVTQWAEWGIDYLKYDWNPIELPETTLMYNTLAASGRDIILSLSNSTPISNVQSLDQVANSYRTDGDISDSWSRMITEISDAAAWAPYAAPGHWSDPDMLEIGNGGMTDNEETTHISMWCMLEAPLLLGTNMTKIGSFELSLCTNAEVIALDQDALGNQAVPVAGSITSGSFCVYEKHLEDGSIAVALVNTGTTASSNATATWSELGISGSQTVVDLWRQQSQGVFNGSYSYTVPAGDTQLVRMYPPLMISTIAAQEIAPNTSTAPIYLTVTDSQAAISTEAVTATSSNPTLVPQSGLSLNGSGANWILTVTPAANLTGSCTISMMVNDGISTATNSFNLTVNTPPSISAIPWQLVNQNTTVGPLAFTVSDQNTSADSLVVSATSTNNTMVPTGNITLGGSGTNRTVTVTPANNTGGTATIIVSVSDGIDTRWSAFPIWIYLPTITTPATLNLGTNMSGTTTVNIGDSRVEPYLLTVTGTSNNSTLLPSGSIVASGTGTQRTITVTPAANQSGTATVYASVSDGVNTATSNFQLTVTGSASPVITSGSSAAGNVGGAFSYQITASNSPTSYNAAGLPAGLSVNTSTGVISGAPTTTGTSGVTISASNAVGTGSATLTIAVSPQLPPVITSASSATGYIVGAFSYQITASNSPTGYNAAGLPGGLSVSTSTGLISGTPTATGTSGVTISASNVAGTGSAALTIEVSATPVQPVIASGLSATGTVGGSFSYQIPASNDPTSYTATGLPGGLSVSPSTGLISGTPTATGASSVAISASNIAGTGTGALTITVLPTSDGIWISAAGGSWTGSANWQGGGIPSGSGYTADFSTLTLGANAAVTLDAPQLIGNVLFGDTAPYGWILNTGSSGGSLTLSGAGAAPTITVENQWALITAILAGTQGLTASGTGTLILTGDNTYTGATVINSGAILEVGTGGNATAALGKATVNGSATQVSDNGALEFDYSGSPSSGFLTGLSGTGALALLHGGGNYAVKLDGSNAGFNGPITVGTGARLQVSSDVTGYSAYDEFVNASTITVQSGGEYFVDNTADQPFTFNNNWVLSGTQYNGDGSPFGVLRISAVTAMTGALSMDSTILLAVSNTTSIGGPITDGGNGYALEKSETSILNLSNTGNNWSGGTYVDAGTLQLGVSNALPTSGTLTLGYGGASTGSLTQNTAGTLDINGYSATIGGLLNAGSGASAIGNSSTTASGTLTFAGGSTFNHFGGVIQDTISGGDQTTALAVSSGTLELTSANTYSGGTIINGGLLLAANTAGSALGSGVVTVASQGVLGGTGAIGGPVTVSGTLSPGLANSGTLTVNNNLVLTASAALQSGVGTSGGIVAVNGNVTLGGTLNVVNTGGMTSGTYNLISYSGALINNGLSIGVTPSPNYAYQVDTSVAGKVNLDLIPLPTITSIASQNLSVNASTGALSFTIGDSLVPPADLIVTVTASNSALLPPSGLALGGAGASRTITVTPAVDTLGSGVVTILVSDGTLTTDGTFEVTVTGSPAQTWRFDYFGTTANTGNAADTANPSGDGIVNLIKYALGMNPNVNSQSGLPVLSATGGSLEITFNRNTSASDITYYVQASDDMVNWTTLATWAAGGDSWTQTGATVTDVNGAVTAVDNTPIGSQPHRFLQLQVSGP